MGGTLISKDKTNQTIRDLVEQLFIKDKKFVNIYNFHEKLAIKDNKPNYFSIDRISF